jgi:hypothetical protein
MRCAKPNSRIPRGEGEPVAVTGQFGGHCCNRRVVAHRSKIETETRSVRIAQTRTTIHPLLGGEGRGEGGCKAHSPFPATLDVHASLAAENIEEAKLAGCQNNGFGLGITSWPSRE